MEENTKPKKGFKLLSATTAVSIAFVALLGFLYITFYFYHSEIIPYKFFEQATGNYAQLIAGVIGTLLSFAGIILIYATFKEQQESNKAQEDKLNRQTELFNQQQFETTFFNLIENHFRIIKSFDAEFHDRLRKEKSDKSGYNQLNELYRRFRNDFEEISELQISSPYGCHKSINFYPLKDYRINVPLVKKSVSNINLILDYISSSKQVKDEVKELYGRILFSSLNESEIYFFVCIAYLETGKSKFEFKDFDNYFKKHGFINAAKFNLNQSMGFYYQTLEASNMITMNFNEVEMEMNLYSKREYQNISALMHKINGENINLQNVSIILEKPFRKVLDITIFESSGGSIFNYAIPIVSILKEKKKKI